MINNTQEKPPMPKQTIKLIGTLVILLFVAVGILLFKNNSEMPLTQFGNGYAESDSKLPAIDKAQSTPTVDLAVVQAEGPNAALITISSQEMAQLVDGVELNLHYDPDKVSNVTITPSELFSSVVRNTVDAEKGVISLAVVRLPDETVAIDAEVILATITYKPGQTGEIMFSFAPDATVVAGNQGDNLLKSIKDLTVTNN